MPAQADWGSERLKPPQRSCHLTWGHAQVGKAFSKNKSVTVAKIDATANDVPKKFEVCPSTHWAISSISGVSWPAWCHL